MKLIYKILILSIVFLKVLSASDISQTLNFINKSPVISKMQLSYNSAYTLTRADSAVLLYEVLKLKNDDFKLPYDLELYNKPFRDIDVNSDYYQALITLANFKGSDDITVFNKNFDLFNPLRQISRFEFVKIIIEGFNIAKSNDYSNLTKFKDYDLIKNDTEAKKYFATAVKYGIIKGSEDDRLLPYEKLTILQGLYILNRVINNKVSTKESYFEEPNMDIVDGNSIDLINEIQEYNPTLPEYKISKINSKKVGTCIELQVVSNANDSSKEFFQWNTNIGSFISISKNGKDVKLCPTSKKPNVDYKIEVEGSNGYSDFASKTLTIDKDIFSYQTNISNNYETAKEVRNDIQLVLDKNTLKENNYFEIKRYGDVYKNNLDIGIEAISIELENANKKVFVPSVKWDDDRIYFLVPSVKEFYSKNIKIHINIITNQDQLSYDFYNINYKPMFLISGRTDVDNHGKYPAYVKINNKQIKTDKNGFFSYEPESSGIYNIVVSEDYKIYKVMISDQNPVKNLDISYIYQDNDTVKESQSLSLNDPESENSVKDDDAQINNIFIDYSLSVNSDKLKISWRIKNAKYVKYEYSFDKKNWKKLTLINLSNESIDEKSLTIQDLNKNNVIYVRADVLGNDSVHYFQTKDLKYIPEISEEKYIELPKKTILRTSINTKNGSLTVKWSKILDSRYKLNVSKYELNYWDAKRKDVKTLTFKDNSNTNNLYSDNIREISGLQNNIHYYFRVRGCNDLGCGEWSNVDDVYIDIPHKSTFVTSYQSPANNASGVSKKPIFKWKVNNPDNKDLEYYVRWGEDKNNLNARGPWSSPEQSFDYRDAGYNKDLKPNTKYYWQVVMREQHHIMDEYVKSPIWSFRTTKDGADIAISEAKLLTKVEPGKKATFELTLVNLGTEPTKPVFIQAYYKKGDKTTPFINGSVKFNQILNRNGLAKIKVDVTFKTYPFTNSQGVEYDNVLVPGESYVVFDMPYIKYDGFDTNTTDNKKEVKIVYDDNNRPKFYDITLKNNFLSLIMNDKKDFYGVLNKPLTIIYDVGDDSLVKKLELFYRVSENDEWKKITTLENTNQNTQNKMNGSYDWLLPDNQNLLTDGMQIKLKAYDSDTTYSEYVTKPFKVVNQLKIFNISLDKNSYKTGDKAYINFDFQGDLPIKHIKVVYYTANNSGKTVYESYKNSGLSFSSPISVNIPDDNYYASDSAYFKIEIEDTINQTIKVTTDNFKVDMNNKLPKIFYKQLEVYNKLNTEAQSNAKNKDSYNQIEAIKFDGDNLHIVVSSNCSYFIDNENYVNRKFYYLFYNAQTKKLSSPVEIIKDDAKNSEDIRLKDIILFGSNPVLLFQKKNDFYISYKENGSFSDLEKVLDNKNVKWDDVKFFKYDDNIYIKWIDDSLGSETEDRRNTYKMVYPSIGSKKLFADEYLGHYIQINDNKFYDSCNVYLLDENLNLGKKIFSLDKKCTLMESNHYFTSEASIIGLNYNNTYHIVGKIENELIDFEIGRGFYNEGALFSDEFIVYNMYNKTIYKYSLGTKTIQKIQLDDNFAYDNNELLYDISLQKHMAFGNIRNKEKAFVYLADLSKDIESPNVEFINNKEIKAQNGDDISLKWSVKDNSKISKVSLFEVIDGKKSLIKEFDNNEESYSYKIHSNVQNIELVLEAVDDAGNIGYDKTFVKVIKLVTFKSFKVDKNIINLGEKLTFSWESDGDNTTEYKVYKKDIDSSEWELLFKVVGVKSKSVYINDFAGEYNFKIVANSTEKVLDDDVLINGYVFSFKNDLFYPNGEYIIDSKDNSIKLEWKDNTNELTYYDIWIKKDKDSVFKKVGTTSDKFYYYQSSEPFDWQISVDYDGKIVSSKINHVQPYILTTPEIKEISYGMDDKENMFVKLLVSKVDKAFSYNIYRTECGSGDYKLVTNSKNTEIFDYDVEYGKCYSYKVAALAENMSLSESSKSKDIDLLDDNKYSVIIKNKNNQLLQGNSIVLEYYPSKNVKYEKYEVLIGRDPNKLFSYTTTSERKIVIDNLDFATTYYVEIFPLDIAGNRLTTVGSRLTFTTGFDTRVIKQTPEVSVFEADSSGVLIGWDYVKNADKYAIYRKENNKDFTYLYTTEDNIFEDDIDIKSGSRYQYKVVAFNNNMKKESLPTKVITIKYPDTDGDGYTDNEDAFPNDPTEWVDTDGDGVGNNADHDDDNDGIKDVDEEKYGLNPLDPTDALEDSDGDGVDNKDEILFGTDPHDPNEYPDNSVYLYKGWNLVNIKPSISQLNNKNIKLVWTYQDKKWKVFSSDSYIKQKIEDLKLSKLTELKPDNGLWILAEDNIKLKPNDQNITKYNLQKGWNLKGSNKNIPIKLFKDLGGKYIWKYSAKSKNKWSLGIVDDSIKNIVYPYKFSDINQTEGFWIMVK